MQEETWIETGEFILKLLGTVAAALFAVWRAFRSWEQDIMHKHALLEREVNDLRSKVATKADLEHLEDKMSRNNAAIHDKIDDSNKWLLQKILDSFALMRNGGK